MPVASQRILMTFGALDGNDEWAMSHGPNVWTPLLFRNFADHRFSGDGFDTRDTPVFFQPPTSGAGPTPPGLPAFSWDQAAAQLTRIHLSWSSAGSPATVTYGFRDTAPLVMPDGTSGFSQFSPAQIAAAEMALQLWSDVANITFTRVNPAGYTNNATILFANYVREPIEESAFAFYPGSTAASASAGDVWVNLAVPENSNFTLGTFGPQVLAHEIGHAIGIAHPADYDASDDDPPTYLDDAVYWQDSRAFTVMSYFGSPPVGFALGAFAAGPQLHDIAAAQLLYGPNMSTRTGDTVYGFNSNTGRQHYTITADGASPVFAIWDAGGVDTLDLSGYSTSVEIDLREEAFSSAGPSSQAGTPARGNIAIARGAVIENGVGGSGNDILTGNNVANTLTGNGGNDTVNGGSGNDTLNGGMGDDTLDGGTGVDQLLGGDGDDVIFWDAADSPANVQGGAGADILVFISGAAPTGFNLVSHGFESAENRLTDPGGNPWASQIIFFDAAWRTDLHVTFNDDGSRAELDYDQLNAFDFATNFNQFDPAGGLDINVTVYDTGVTAAYDFDQANTFDWVSNWNQYNAAGALDTNVTVFDSGIVTSNDFDPDDLFDWTSNWIQNDAGGLLDLNVTVFDTGVTSAFDFDQTDSFDWVSNWNQYNAGGELDINVTVFDDGTSNANDFDQDELFDWTSNWSRYDSLDRLDLNITVFDNGNTAVLDYDQANEFTWATIWKLFDPAGNLIDFQQVNDDGSIFGP